MNDSIIGYISSLERFSQHDTGGVVTIIPTVCRYPEILGPGNPMRIVLPEVAFKKCMLAFASQVEVDISILYEVSSYERKKPAPPHNIVGT